MLVYLIIIILLVLLVLWKNKTIIDLEKQLADVRKLLVSTDNSFYEMAGSNRRAHEKLDKLRRIICDEEEDGEEV